MQLIAQTDSATQQPLTLGGKAFVAALTRYLLTLMFCFVLCIAYEIMSRWWSYFGFTYQLTEQWMRVAACFIAAIPAILLTARPSSFAQGAAWFLYTLVFLPCMLVTVMQFSSSGDRVFLSFVSIWVASALFLWLARGNVRRLAVPEMPSKIFWGGIAVLWTSLMVMILYTFGRSFQFVGVDDIYNQRYVGAGLATNAFVRYSIALLASAIDPFLIAAGLYSRRYWISSIGIGGQVLLFGTLAAKGVLLSPLIIVGTYILTDGRANMRGNLMLIGLLGVAAITFPLLLTYNPVGGGINELTSLIYMRTFLISGATFGVYDQFFSVYPVTYFSNNNIISWFVDYPYGDLSVGQAVQSTLLATPTSAEIGELNASFLATDGIAALGKWGVPVAAIGCALVLRFISKFVPTEKTMLMMASGAGFVMSLSNTSILTSLVTGGGVILTALVCIAPFQRNERASETFAA